MLLYSTMLDVNDTLTKEKFIQLVIKWNQENEALRAGNADPHSKFGEMWSWGMRKTSFQGRSRSWCCQSWLMSWTVGLRNVAEEAMFFSDLIEKNDYQGVYRKKKAEIQRILKNYTIMDAKTRKALQDFGFRIEEDGKHYRLTYFGDDRYNTTVAKTPSDARAGKNIAHYIEQTMM